MRHLFIINPAAGKKDSTQALEDLLTKLSFDHEVVYTEGEGHARQIAEEAAAKGEPIRIYACGGDGTLNEVVNGAAGHDHVAITCVPKGTGNDFLKVFGPNYHQEFYDLEELACGPQTALDLIDCNGKLGIDVVCLGLDARIGVGVHRYKNWYFISGMGAYVMSLLENVLFKGMTKFMSVRMGGETWQGDTTIVCVCNGRHYGGGFMPVPDAMPDDGVLDMLLIPKVGLFTLARLIGQYAKGRYKDYPHLIREHHGSQVTITTKEKSVAAVDGEAVWGTEFTIRLSEKKVNFFYPAGSSYQVDGKTSAQEAAV